LVSYVKEVNPNKKCVLLLNKADLLTVSQRKQWANYFHSKNIDFRYFSAYLERLAMEESQKAEKQDDDEDDIVKKPIVVPERNEDNDEDTYIMNVEELSNYLEGFNDDTTDKRVVIGMVGYPNVGKSSTINVLCKQKKVAESSTPGKTKHFQTIILNEKICLCDCPGLVFPSFIATKADMVCNGLLPIDQMRDHVNPMALVCLRIPRRVFENLYGLSLPDPSDFEDPNRPPTPHELMQEYGRARGFMASHGMPDEPRSARYILKDYVNGKLRYAHPPPSVDPFEFNNENYKDIPMGKVNQLDTVSGTIEEMNRPKKPIRNQNLYQGKRKIKRNHQGEGQETVEFKTKGYQPRYGQKLPTNIRL